MSCRFAYAFCFAWVWLIAGVGSASDRLCLDDAPVCIEAVQSGATVSFFVENGTVAPYSVRVAFEELENLKPLVPVPFRGVVEPGDRRVIGTLATRNARKHTRFGYRWGAAMGSSLARPSASPHYRMPFGGTARRFLGQGVGGRFSHTGPSKWSFDFGMPWGTPILAARAGRVVEVVDGHIASDTHAHRGELH